MKILRQSITGFKKEFVTAMLFDSAGWLALFIIFIINFLGFNYLTFYLPTKYAQVFFVAGVVLLTSITYVLSILVIAYFKRKIYLIIKGKEVSFKSWFNYHLIFTLPLVIVIFISLLLFNKQTQAYIYSIVFLLYGFFVMLSNVRMGKKFKKTFMDSFNLGVPMLFTSIIGLLPLVIAVAIMFGFDIFFGSYSFILKILTWIVLYFFFKNHTGWYNKQAPFVFIFIGYLLALVFSSFFIYLDVIFGVDILFKVVLVLSLLLTTQWARYYLFLATK